MGLFDNMLNNAVSRASSEFGRAVGSAAGTVVGQAADNYKNDMKFLKQNFISFFALHIAKKK